MREGLKKITIEGASGWCPSNMAFNDKLTIKPDGMSYERKPVEENEMNPHSKWSYKTNSKNYKAMFDVLCQQIPEFEQLEEMFVTDINPNRVKFFFEGETLTFDTYFYDGVEHFADMVKLMVPNTEDVPDCLPYSDEGEEDDEDVCILDED